MKMLLTVDIPHEPFNALVRSGKAGELIGRILETIKPEAAYFTEQDGRRGGIFVAGDSGTAVPAEIWVAQFDAAGRSQRENRLPAAAADRAAALAEMADGRLVLAGTAEIEGSGRRGAGLLYLDRSGHLVAER